MSLSTHVLDAAAGAPATGVPVRLERRDGTVVFEGKTDDDGRISGWNPEAGVYRLVFEVDGEFYPEVVVTFRITDDSAHYHVPLLLSPFAYSTYRGS
ncbi:5-hydroxyisourate hydrolase [Amycolatopsis xylanica]|uniref:5-hydroxyisourate hydrolase n=1 Tax=Amycolatopsis xylanica TaxID=589385 RepID=A0A1H2UIA6_9PSEU|nr:hydroxyisourate hydrolase [Amycolatopsis xylanica]SDW55648.1 5-hydroxyisourate hydrolase [Amycolatopsis xylanica]